MEMMMKPARRVRTRIWYMSVAVSVVSCTHPPRVSEVAEGSQTVGAQAGSPADTSFEAMQQRGARVMGVDQYASTHTFDELPDGGRISLVSNTGEQVAVDAIRAHMQSIARDFARGDFTNPSLVHMTEVPGTAILKRKARSIEYRYEPTARGGAVRIVTKDAAAIAALREFMQYQRTSHHAGGMDHASMSTHD